MDKKPLRIALQACNYAVFMALVGYCANAPSIRLLAADEAVLTIAFAHAGQLREPCRRLSQEELNELAPNMRRIEDCPRQRSPVSIEARLDDAVVFADTLTAPGLFEDGGVDVYFSKKIAAGEHRLSLAMNDSRRIDGYNHRWEGRVTIEPARVLLIGFATDRGFLVDDSAD